MKSNRYICIHGHFYQPPRENPWLGVIETEESAFPHHDWNWRILHESYGPNAASPLFTAEGEIEDILNNYSLMSFNFGPTLLSWIEKHSRQVYMSVLEADALSTALRSGHGNAIAQVYNHVIMPLASLRDKKTQVRWGVEDFIHRFRRRPEGMWLPETAADDETLETLCDAALKFTILSPFQALKFRHMGIDKWEPANKLNFDTTRPYRWFSKTIPGRFVDIFFYNAPLAESINIDGILNNPDRFYNSLTGIFSDDSCPQLAHVATDGENYGHYYPNANASLSRCLSRIEKEKSARLTNYGEFLEKNPPVFEVEIISPSSWSCLHGVDRWRDDCGCSRLKRPGWNQKWRKPLRQSLDWLAKKIDALYEEKAGVLFWDPWQARNDYIRRIFEESVFGVKKFLTQCSCKHLSREETRRALSLLEMQRNRMLMFTSCGWFFDDISGIEPVQLLKYASRSICLAESFGVRLENEFTKRLKDAKSNLARFKNGSVIYENSVKPLQVTMERAAVHSCIMNFLGENLPLSGPTRFHSKVLEEARFTGESRAYTACISIETTDTLDHTLYSVAAVQGKETALRCHAKECDGVQSHRLAGERVAKALKLHDDNALPDVLKKDFSPRPYDLSAVFSDKRHLLSFSMPKSRKARSSSTRDYSAIYHEWFAQLRSFEAGHGLSERLLSTLKKFRREGISYGDVPFMDEIRNYFTSHFSLVLARRLYQETSRTLEWLNFFCQPGARWGAWEFQSILHKWMKQNPSIQMETGDFAGMVKEAASILNLQFKHKRDHKKTPA